ncbi:MAG TPA: hypothetical protein VJN43_16710 [Bryobacteraceae bacterium]|nr:hypothetical protein [Bryobacteraceae bacterium]
MSHRLQILIPEDLDGRIEKAARLSRQSKGAWVRHAIQIALERPATGPSRRSDPLVRLASLQAPAADIEEMISEIKAGRA